MSSGAFSDVRIALYHNLPRGGAMRFLEETVSRSAAVHEYDLFRIESPGMPPESLAGVVARATTVSIDGPRFPLSIAHGAETLARLWRAERAVAEMIDAGDYDLCLVHACRITQAPSLLSRLRTRAVYFAQEPRRLSFERAYASAFRGGGPLRQRAADATLERVLRAADRRAFTAASAVGCNSRFSAEALFRCYARDAHICMPGVDCVRFSPQAGARGGHVIAVGALDRVKGHELVIDALSLVAPERRPGLVIVSERSMPGYASHLCRRAATAGVDLRLVSGIADAELVHLYGSALATMGAARLEPFGLTTLESLACGTPVVAIAEGGYREVVRDGVDGRLVRPDAASMASGLEWVLGAALDPSVLRTRATTMSWDATVERIHGLLDSVVAV